MNVFQKIWVAFVKFFGNIHWPASNLLGEIEHRQIKELLKPDYYIIVTRRSNYLSTYMIAFANLVLTGKLSHWSHVLMNLEDEVKTDDDYLLIEAIGTGVTVSKFDTVFNVNSVALLKPRNMPIEQWTAVLDSAKNDLGKSYDNLFDLKTDQEVSCVELIRNALKTDPNYDVNFAEFERMIRKSKNLTPQMFYDCPDFEVVYEIRKRN